VQSRSFNENGLHFMTRDVRLYLWMTISLVAPAVNGRDLRGEDDTQSVSSNPAVIIAIVEAHQQAMRAERPTARQGDMFFPTITDLFRRWILESLHGMTPDEFLVRITENDAPPMAPPSVNASYPDGGALTTMPPQLLQVFPTLPSGLEYRFIDRDLILRDSHANLIIDFIPEALSIADES
jgi:hypothetical protein